MLFSLLPTRAECSPQEAFIVQATQKNLFLHPMWRKLLHYRPGPIPGSVKSQIDDEAFFLAPNGDSNPEEELAETIRSMFLAPDDTDPDAHTLCRFKARSGWISGELGIEASLLPVVNCPRYNEWIQALRPKSLTLIFASAFLNNPASMFGHTFLRIDAADQDESTRLLAYTAGYAAITGGEPGLIYALKGLFGGYRGQFGIDPYYRAVAKYNDIENRDIWELRLNFSEPEIQRVIDHLWELLPHYLDYYYLGENCSYHLNSLLQVARTEFDFVSMFPFWAIPADTLRAVTREDSLISDVQFRPARATTIHSNISQLTTNEKAVTKQISLRNNNAPLKSLGALPETSKARVLDTSLELLEYQRLKAKEQDEEGFRKSIFHALQARSVLPVGSVLSPPNVPDVRPDDGHKTARFSFGMGRELGENFSELRYRPAFHDLLDSPGGYIPGAELIVFDTVLRSREPNELKLQSLTPLLVMSLTPLSEFFKPLSWRVSSSVFRKQLTRSETSYTGELSGGAGISIAPFEGALSFLLADARVEYSGQLDENFAFGTGPRAGVAIDLGEVSKLKAQWLLETHYIKHFLGENYPNAEISSGVQFQITSTLALRLNVSRSVQYEHYFNSGTAQLIGYF